MALKRVLITGAAGQIGTALWKAWEAEERYELTLADVREIEGARARARSTSSIPADGTER